MSRGLAAKFPLSISETFGRYDLHTDLKSMVRQNLKMLLLTIPGERIMDPDFGIGLMSFLHEMNTESLRNEIRAKIDVQVDRYLNFIEIEETSMQNPQNESNNVLALTIKYKIVPISEEDILSITLQDFSL